MKSPICVYDFETDGPDPQTCEPVQLAACIIHPIRLEVIEGSEFCLDLRPTALDKKDEKNKIKYIEDHKSTIEWHSKIQNISVDEVIRRWENGTEQKMAWTSFTSYLEKYNTNQARKSRWSAPIRAGANIRRFDNLIIDRLCTKYKNVDKNNEQSIFYPRDTIDIVDLSFYWFENLREPESYNMDTLRKFFGIPLEGAHDALKDIRDEAWMIIKFIKLFRRFSSKIAFKGSYKNDD